MDGEVTFDGPRTDLDSHANMPVVGRNSYIIERLDRTVDIKPFTSDYKAMTAELVLQGARTNPAQTPGRPARESLGTPPTRLFPFGLK